MFKNLSKFLALTLMSVMLITAFSGCSDEPKEDNASESDVINIGVLVPTSGSENFYGRDMLQSYELAVNEINEEGGVLGKELRLFQADDGADPSMATRAANRIISNGVDFVVGGYASGATIPTMRLFYDEDLVFLISAANSTEITDLGLEQTFMLNSPGTHAADTLLELVKSLNVKSVALIHQGDSYTKNLSDICSQLLPENDVEVATVQVMEKGAADVSAIVTAINNSNAEFVYWCGYHADGANVIKQLRQGGYEGDIAVGDGSASPELITFCGPDGEGVYVTSPPFVKFADGGEKFVSSYKEKFGSEPANYSSLSYDTIYVLKEAIEKAGSTDYIAVRDAVQDIEYNGLSGLIKFTPDRELAKSNFIVLQIKDGDFELVDLD